MHCVVHCYSGQPLLPQAWIKLAVDSDKLLLCLKQATAYVKLVQRCEQATASTTVCVFEMCSSVFGNVFGLCSNCVRVCSGMCSNCVRVCSGMCSNCVQGCSGCVQECVRLVFECVRAVFWNVLELCSRLFERVRSCSGMHSTCVRIVFESFRLCSWCARSVIMFERISVFPY